MSAESAARVLDDEILRGIGAWRRGRAAFDDAAFNDLALRIFAYQLERNEPYRRYCSRFGVTPANVPSSWETIPAVPAGAFKESTLTTFDPLRAALHFETSGTTGTSPGRHFMETRELYDAALLAAFDRFVLADDARLRYLNLVPRPSRAPRSSLGYMLGIVSERRGDGKTGWYTDDNQLRFFALRHDLQVACDEGQAVCITSTAFALVHLLDAMDAEELHVALPFGSRIVETGGFKGRARTIDRADLYARLRARFGLPDRAVIAEYGMTELTSQYYDDTMLVARPQAEPRRKVAPPWLRTRVVGPDRTTLPIGQPGALVHVDLANRSSCVAIATEDVGIALEDGLVLIGRDEQAPLRGCSLDAEALLASGTLASRHQLD